MPALQELFHQKCAFCETRVGATSRPDLEQFRPKAGALDLEGERSPDHYWWLMFDWENLYPSCPACNRTKGSRFPVVGERAERGADAEATREEVWAERALLLDPCRDHPSDHLIFDSLGNVAAVPFEELAPEEQERFGEPTRGRVTIDHLRAQSTRPRP